MELEIRPLGPSDIPRVAELLGELGYPSSPEELTERFRPLLRSNDDRLLLGVVEGKPQAFASLHRIPLVHRSGAIVRLTAFVVAQTARRQGLGSALLSACEEVAVDLGAERLEITSGASREDAHAFYTTRGFGQEGIRFSKWITRE